MARKLRYPPKAHRSGQARLVWRGKTYYLGLHGSESSYATFARLVAEIEATGQPLPARGQADRTVEESLSLYWTYAETLYCRGRDEPSSQLGHIRRALAVVLRLYGPTPAAEFGPRSLKAVRATLVSAGHCRGHVNRLVNLVKAAFAWLTSEELIPPAVHHALTSVRPLRRHESDAPESAAVGPVPADVVDATLPFLTRAQAVMVQLQQLTGMRPGEVCRLRLDAVDRSGDVWAYRPAQHKTRHRGKERVIFIGPKAQALLRPRLAMPGWLFPAPRNRKRPYRTETYAASVAVAAEKAGVPHWHPHQLRHSAATAIREACDLETAAAVLGHAGLAVTLGYALPPQQKAMEAMRRLG